jgi:hypothetical protein
LGIENPLANTHRQLCESYGQLEALHDYVFRTAHSEVLRQRKQWFEKFPGPYYALWWVPQDHIPTVEEGKERLAHLAAHGPSVEAFWFGTPLSETADLPAANSGNEPSSY